MEIRIVKEVVYMKRWALPFIILAILLSSGCITGSRPSPTPAVTASSAPTALPSSIIYISGVVIDQDGVPVPDARVALWQGPELVQMPDNPRYASSAGLFNFTNLQPARYQVAAYSHSMQGEVDRRFYESASIEVVIPGYHVSTTTPAPSQGPVAPGMPNFNVQRTGPTSVQVNLVSFGVNVTTLRGFYVKSPAISTQEIIPVDVPLAEDETILITDPKLAGPVDFVAASWVNGNYVVVVNTTV